MSQGINNNPYVKISNWEHMLQKGWRWAINLPIRTESNSDEIDDMIETYIVAFGERLVTVGNAFNHEYHAPAGDPNNEYGIAIYIRDAEALIRELRRDMAKWEEEGVEFS